ncbi:MAG: guanylate kinase [Lachnospiraceae bacterium]|nr:guanylate kinase [Lachnospiraceae bacterium]
MGNIFCIMGKSATGKDSLYKYVLEHSPVPLVSVITYTTRPVREGEQEGIAYHFVTNAQFESMNASGKVIEYRCYHTVFGDWYYFTADDGQIKDDSNYLLIMTLEGYASLSAYYGKERVIPIYIEVEDGLRLERALGREREQEKPAYAEMCRRFLADCEDFSEEKLTALGITHRFQNIDFENCAGEITDYIKSMI